MKSHPDMACMTPVRNKTAAEQLPEGCLHTAGRGLKPHGVTALHTSVVMQSFTSAVVGRPFHVVVVCWTDAAAVCSTHHICMAKGLYIS